MLFVKSNFVVLMLVVCVMTACAGNLPSNAASSPNSEVNREPAKTKLIKNESKVIHVIVALCDNEYQGIVPVSASLGNGDKPGQNLYWGAAYGLSTFFSKSDKWESIDIDSPQRIEILKRIAFRHKESGALLIADAYRGREIKAAVTDFLNSAAGSHIENVEVADQTVQIGRSSDILVYVGHNGLMDFTIDKPITETDNPKRDAIVLACFSKKYFDQMIEDTNTNSLLMTTNLMAPEAYILHDALEAKLNGESGSEVRDRAAGAYAKYQKISFKAARGLFVTE